MNKRVEGKRSKVAVNSAKSGRFGAGKMLLVLAVVISLLLGGGYLPGHIQFSNDGPLGRLVAQCHELPGRFTGCWNDLNFVGYSEGAALPGIGFGLQYLLKPVFFSKFYVPLALLILGFGAWCFFRQLGLSSTACVLGGLAATLNSAFFSVACWGVAAHTITAGLCFFALAALASTVSPLRWWRVALAGFAVGMGVTEGADVGAIFSLLVAAFLVYQAIITEGPRAKNAFTGFGRMTLLVFCAVFLAAQAIFQLVVTDIEGVTIPKRAVPGVTARWDWATQWSLSKREALGLVVPGLFGYRMDTPDGGNYWGMMGRDVAWDKYSSGGQSEPPQAALRRFTGGGFYCGVVVVVLAIWSGIQSLRRKETVFSQLHRRWIWFWLVTSVVSLLLAFGRYAPFYRMVFDLPYFSTIRNPVKFLYIFAFCLIVLFAFGVDALSRKYMPVSGPKAAMRWAGPAEWWARAEKFDKRWGVGCLVILALVLIAWWIYASSSQSVEEYLQRVQIDISLAIKVAEFSVHQVGWFVVFYILTAGWMILTFSGAFTGPRAKWGGIWLGILLAIDLGRANQPWIQPVDYKYKYASNPIVEILREKPYEHRVAMLRFPGPGEIALFNRVYQIEWNQHLFPCYNIESFDVVQMSRSPKDIEAFKKALAPDPPTKPSPQMIRYWQLTNTRYLLGAVRDLDLLNGKVSPNQGVFRIVSRFKLVPKAGTEGPVKVGNLTAEPHPEGQLALFEFTGSLPRARLFGNWEVESNDQAALDTLASAAFDPQKTVLVSDGTSVAPVSSTNQDGGSVEYESYAAKHIVLKSQAAFPSLLLLNDRYDPNWKVQVDGKAETLQRCNYIMRGVFLQPGSHTVEFIYQPPVGFLYVSLAAIGLSIALLAFVVVSECRGQDPKAPVPLSSPAVPPPVKTAPQARPSPPREAQPVHSRRK